VRKAANAAIGSLIAGLAAAPEVQSKLMSEVVALATERSFIERQIFTAICYHLVGQLADDVFRDRFLTPLLALAKDRVRSLSLSLSLRSRVRACECVAITSVLYH
jgi:hypothetical protein